MIALRNLAKTKIDEKLLHRVAKIVLKGENKGTENVSVILVDSKKIRKLNKKYREQNKATDVLAFGENSQFSNPNFQTSLLGEIILCLPEIKKNAGEYKIKFEEELARVLIHGILHLLGYEHENGGKKEKIMEEKTEKYLRKLF